MSIICQRWLETFHLQESASYHLFVTTSSKFASQFQIRLSVPWQFIKQKRKLISIHFSSLSSPGANLREATMDNWQGANIQNPHKLGVVLIASGAFPGNNFVPLPTPVTCVWPINWRIRDRPRQALLECSTPGWYRHAKTCRSCRPESAIFWIWFYLFCFYAILVRLR